MQDDAEYAVCEKKSLDENFKYLKWLFGNPRERSWHILSIFACFALSSLNPAKNSLKPVQFVISCL